MQATRSKKKRAGEGVPGLRGEGGAVVVAQRFALGGGEGQKALAQLGEAWAWGLGHLGPPG